MIGPWTKVPVSPEIALAFLLRQYRLRHGWTQKEMAERLGIKGSLYKYQRLENSRPANPELKTLAEIKRAFPDFSLDELVA